MPIAVSPHNPRRCTATVKRCCIVKTTDGIEPGNVWAVPNSSQQPAQSTPLYRELFWPTLRALQVLGGSGTRQEVLAKAVEIGGYTEDQQAELMPNGRTSRIRFYASWCLTRLKRIGLVENSQHGVWALTERGRGATEAQVPALWEEMREAYRRLREERKHVGGSTDIGGTTDDDDADVEGWKDALLERVKALDPSAFERLAQRLLREANFEKVIVTGRAGDQGIDGVGLVRLGLLSFPTYFQCKRYQGSVGAGAVRDFRGAMAGRGEKGLLITTGAFTPAAQQESTRDGVPPIDLIDGDALCDLLKRFRVGVNVHERLVEDVTIDGGFWSDFN